MVIAANRRLAVHHVTVQRLGGRLSVSLDLEVDRQMPSATPTGSHPGSKPRSAANSARRPKSRRISSPCRTTLSRGMTSTRCSAPGSRRRSSALTNSASGLVDAHSVRVRACPRPRRDVPLSRRAKPFGRRGAQAGRRPGEPRRGGMPRHRADHHPCGADPPGVEPPASLLDVRSDVPSECSFTHSRRLNRRCCASLMSSRRFAPLFWCQFSQRLQRQFNQRTRSSLLVLSASARRHRPRTVPAWRRSRPPCWPCRRSCSPASRASSRTATTNRSSPAASSFSRSPSRCWPAPASFFIPVPVLMACVSRARADGRLFQPDQIRHPARPSEARGIARRQRPDRGRTFLSILLGVIAGGFAPAASTHGSSPPSWCHRPRLLALGDLHPARPARRPRRCESIPTSCARHATSCAALRADPPPHGGRHRVSWFWLVGAVVLSLVPPLAMKSSAATRRSRRLSSPHSRSASASAPSSRRTCRRAGSSWYWPRSPAVMARASTSPGWPRTRRTERRPIGVGAFLATVRVQDDGSTSCPRHRRRPVHRAGIRRGPGLRAEGGRASVIAGVNVVSALFMTAGAVLLAILRPWRCRPRPCSPASPPSMSLPASPSSGSCR